MEQDRIVEQDRIEEEFLRLSYKFLDIIEPIAKISLSAIKFMYHNALKALLLVYIANFWADQDSFLPNRTAGLYYIFVLALLLVFDRLAKKNDQKKFGNNRYVNKADNVDLRQFEGMQEYKGIPWNIGWSLVLIIQSLFLHAYKAIPLLLAWILTQIIGFLNSAPMKEYLYCRNLRREIFRRREEDREETWKQFVHGILMKDDSHKVAVTFSKGYDRPLVIPVFDRETEISPYEKSHEVDETFWRTVYLNAVFMIYVLDASKYDSDELERECEKAITSYHYQVSRPTYIYIIGSEEKYSYLVRKYEWLWETHIIIVQNHGQINLKMAEDAYIKTRSQGWEKYYTFMSAYVRPDSSFLRLMWHTRWKRDFFCMDYFYINRDAYRYNSLIGASMAACTIFFRWYNLCTPHIYFTVPRVKGTSQFYPENIFLCGFLQNFFRKDDRVTAILAGFDYANMLLSFVLFYLLQKRGMDYSEEFIGDDLQTLGEKIVELTREEDFIYATVVVEKSVVRNVTLNNALWLLEQLLDIDIDEDGICFEGLTNLLRVVRNRTRGHGAIREENKEVLWYSMYILLILLGEMLRICDFRVILQEDDVYFGYGSEEYLYHAGEYAIVQNNKPCLLYQSERNKENKGYKEYINYYEGVVIPQVIRVENEDTGGD